MTINDCKFDGSRRDRELTQQGLWSAGCSSIEVARCSFLNYRDAVYLAAHAGVLTGAAVVRSSHVYRTDHGTADEYVTGIYIYQVADTLIEDCLFENLVPGRRTPTARGYGVYEGDGTPGLLKRVKLSRCRFRASGPHSAYMIGALASVSEVAEIVECKFEGAGFDRGSRITRIERCLFDRADCITGASDGVSDYRLLTMRKNRFLDSPNCPLIVQNVGPRLAEAILDENEFSGAAKGAIWLRHVDRATVSDNAMIDCNTSGDSNDFYRGGGRMHYAVVSSAEQHSIAERANTIRGMIIAARLRV